MCGKSTNLAQDTAGIEVNPRLRRLTIFYLVDGAPVDYDLIVCGGDSHQFTLLRSNQMEPYDHMIAAGEYLFHINMKIR